MSYHRPRYVCKSGVGDVLIGATATVADFNGVEKASHVGDKFIEMAHMNETIYATGVAASYQGNPMPSGAYLSEDMLSNVCKHHVTKLPYEIGRLAQDLAGGLMVTLPYLKGRAEIATEDRVRILRLIENMTLGRNAVGYLTESMHGAGSPQAQRVQIGRLPQVEFKKNLVKLLSGIPGSVAREPDEYLGRVCTPTEDKSAEKDAFASE